jgi:hypothetical protein
VVERAAVELEVADNSNAKIGLLRLILDTLGRRADLAGHGVPNRAAYAPMWIAPGSLGPAGFEGGGTAAKTRSAPPTPIGLSRHSEPPRRPEHSFVHGEA